MPPDRNSSRTSAAGPAAGHDPCRTARRAATHLASPPCPRRTFRQAASAGLRRTATRSSGWRRSHSITSTRSPLMPRPNGRATGPRWTCPRPGRAAVMAPPAAAPSQANARSERRICSAKGTAAGGWHSPSIPVPQARRANSGNQGEAGQVDSASAHPRRCAASSRPGAADRPASARAERPAASAAAIIGTAAASSAPGGRACEISCASEVSMRRLLRGLLDAFQHRLQLRARGLDVALHGIQRNVRLGLGVAPLVRRSAGCCSSVGDPLRGCARSCLGRRDDAARFRRPPRAAPRRTGGRRLWIPDGWRQAGPAATCSCAASWSSWARNCTTEGAIAACGAGPACAARRSRRASASARSACALHQILGQVGDFLRVQAGVHALREVVLGAIGGDAVLLPVAPRARRAAARFSSQSCARRPPPYFAANWSLM